MDPTNVPDEEETSVSEAFLICVVLVGALIGLVLLRFLVNFLIDLLILHRFPTMTTCNSCRSNFVSLCCCWLSVDSSSNHPLRSAGSTYATTRPPSAHRSDGEDTIDVEMSTSAVLSEILPEHILTREDWENLVARQYPKQCEQDKNRIKHQASMESESDTATSSNSVTSTKGPVVECSICLQELLVGMSVYETERCRHFFHAHCIREWLVGTHLGGTSNYHFNNHCPNCRAQLVDPDLRSKLLVVPDAQR